MGFEKGEALSVRVERHSAEVKEQHFRSVEDTAEFFNTATDFITPARQAFFSAFLNAALKQHIEAHLALVHERQTIREREAELHVWRLSEQGFYIDGRAEVFHDMAHSIVQMYQSLHKNDPWSLRPRYLLLTRGEFNSAESGMNKSVERALNEDEAMVSIFTNPRTIRAARSRVRNFASFLNTFDIDSQYTHASEFARLFWEMPNDNALLWKPFQKIMMPFMRGYAPKTAVTLATQE